MTWRNARKRQLEPFRKQEEQKIDLEIESTNGRPILKLLSTRVSVLFIFPMLISEVLSILLSLSLIEAGLSFVGCLEG